MWHQLKRSAVLATIVVVTSAAILWVENRLLVERVAHLSRFTTDFSSTYLQHEVTSLNTQPVRAIFFGDSVLWGFGVPANQTAVSLLKACGESCRNLSFKAGNPANYYAIARIMQANHVRPTVAVIEVNQKVLSSADDFYKTLHPAVAALASQLLDPTDRALLTLPNSQSTVATRADAVLSNALPFYAMRADIRATIFGSSDPPVHRPAPDELVGSYDLTPLDGRNVGVHFLDKTVDLLHAQGFRIVAFLTPTNHELLHDYIDNDAYRENTHFLITDLERRGAHVTDLDDTLPASQFFDFDHLTPEGQRSLARDLTEMLAQKPR
jgi:HAMP domain-containing protein